MDKWKELGREWKEAFENACDSHGEGRWKPYDEVEKKVLAEIASKFTQRGIDFRSARPYAIARIGKHKLYWLDDSFADASYDRLREGLETLLGMEGSGLMHNNMGDLHQLVFPSK